MHRPSTLCVPHILMRRVGCNVWGLIAAVTASLLLAQGVMAADTAPKQSAADLMDVLMWNREPVGGPFALVDHNARPRTDVDFRG